MSTPIIFITINALIWGVSWWPLRFMHSFGLHPAWISAFIGTLATLLISIFYRKALWEVMSQPALWSIALSAGACNLVFNWGITMGEVMRVILLFYLMPLWSIILARVILGERMSKLALGSMVLALLGAAIVLDPSLSHLPVPHTVADYLGILAGFFFALNNVLLRKHAQFSDVARGLAMFVGGMVVGGAGALILSFSNVLAWPDLSTVSSWGSVGAVTTVAFIVANFCLQYSAARLPASLTALLLLAELIFAAISSIALGVQTMSASLFIGGGLIVSATLIQILGRR